MVYGCFLLSIGGVRTACEVVCFGLIYALSAHKLRTSQLATTSNAFESWGRRAGATIGPPRPCLAKMPKIDGAGARGAALKSTRRPGGAPESSGSSSPFLARAASANGQVETLIAGGHVLRLRPGQEDASPGHHDNRQLVAGQGAALPVPP